MMLIAEMLAEDRLATSLHFITLRFLGNQDISLGSAAELLLTHWAR